MEEGRCFASDVFPEEEAAMIHLRYWPVIRHIRYFVLLYRVNRHYEGWMHLGYLPVHAHLDYDRLDAVWRGEA